MPRGEHLRRIPKETRLKNLGVRPLGEGEEARPLQVRGPGEVIQTLKALSPEERGKVAALGLVALEHGVEDPAALGQVLEGWSRLPRAVRWLLARL
jgi:hypothetical protein